MCKIRRFIDELEFAEAHERFWLEIYERVSPENPMVAQTNCYKDMAAQRVGIDRLIHLASGDTVSVEEKLRREDWGDILLEYISNDQKGTPGWIEKELKVDYLAYAFLASRCCYFFPWGKLQRMWFIFKPIWMKNFPCKKADNEYYFTWCCAVPIDTLLSVVPTAKLIQLDD